MNEGYEIWGVFLDTSKYSIRHALREKCPNTELFLVRIQERTDQEKLRIWKLFTQ